MSRRRRHQRGEVKVGSDSFLDVIANIVGILIILIVVAGLRASRTPVVILPEEMANNAAPETISDAVIAAAPANTDAIVAEKKSVQSPQVLVAIPVEEPAEEVEEPEPPPLPPLEVPQELVELNRNLETEIETLKKQESGLVDRLKQSNKQQATLLERQQAIQDKVAEKKREVVDAKKKASIVVADLELARETAIRLAKQVEELESQPANVETLEHRITPLSRAVNGKEKHYRLEHDRVAEVPLDELVSRFREQIDRRREWLSKTRQHQGEIGPIRGFTMKYLVRIESMSDLDAAKSGYGGFRISLAQWEMFPEPDLKGETAEVALKKGSLFYQSILGSPTDTTLTFWVYPDSYGLYRKLQKFAHDHGYAVAGRPLPQGMPIAGSPNGSRSASQ